MTWVAVFAMLCHVLLPVLSQAGMRGSDSSLTTLLCTASGFQLVAINSDEQAPSPDNPLHVQPCPYCLSSHSPALPPAPDAAFVPAVAGGMAFGLATSTPNGKSRSFAAAQPRGPPARMA